MKVVNVILLTFLIINIRSINAQNLSTEEIKALYLQGQSLGLSNAEMLEKAKSEGLISGAQSISGSNRNNQSQGTSFKRTNPSKESLIVSNIDSLKVGEEIKEDVLSIFGMDFFSSTKLSFEPSMNIPTPKNYILGSGDEVVIDIWGDSEEGMRQTVLPNGNIMIPNLGPVYLSGLSVEEATFKIKSILKRNYSSLGKSTFLSVSLGQIRTIKVNIVGNVKYPGSYEFSSFATAFTALYQAGGPSEKGTLRNISIIRNGALVGILDAYSYFLKGEKSANMILMDQDVLMIPSYTSRVAFTGEVKNPAIYEILPEETINDLFIYSGGFGSNAYNGVINVFRNKNNFRTVKSVKPQGFHDFKMINGDSISISKIIDRFKGMITIEGAVYYPGKFEYNEGMGLKDALTLCNGVRGDAFTGRGMIISENIDFTFSITPFNVRDVLNGSSDIVLKENDKIKIQSIFDTRESQFITIKGDVLIPGEQPYIEGMSLESLILLSGGFKESAERSTIEVARRLQYSKEKNSDENYLKLFKLEINEDLKLLGDHEGFSLQPFDVVTVRSSIIHKVQPMIKVVGEVNFPGDYAIEKKDMRISDIIERSGGLTNMSYPKGAILLRKTEFNTDTDEDSIRSLLKRDKMESFIEKNLQYVNNASYEADKIEWVAIRLDLALSQKNSKYDLRPYY